MCHRFDTRIGGIIAHPDPPPRSDCGVLHCLRAVGSFATPLPIHLVGSHLRGLVGFGSFVASWQY